MKSSVVGCPVNWSSAVKIDLTVVYSTILGQLLASKWSEEIRRSSSCRLTRSLPWTSSRNFCGQNCSASKSRSSAAVHRVWPKTVPSSYSSAAGAPVSQRSRWVGCHRRQTSRYLSAWGPAETSDFQFESTHPCQASCAPFKSVNPLSKAARCPSK